MTNPNKKPNPEYRIDKIRVTGFGVTQAVETTIPAPLCVLLGEVENRSRLLDAFSLLNALGNDRSTEYIESRDRMECENGIIPETSEFNQVFLDAVMDEKLVTYCYEYLSRSKDRQFPIERDKLFRDTHCGQPECGGICSAAHLVNGFKPYWLGDIHCQAKTVADMLASFFRAIHVQRLIDVTKIDTDILPLVWGSQPSLRCDGKNVFGFLSMLRKDYPSHYSTITGRVRFLYPRFKSFATASTPCGPRAIGAVWDDASDTASPVSRAPDGFLQHVCLAALLLQPFGRRESPKVIVLDRPESGIPPSAIETLAAMIVKAADIIQVFVFTESAALTKWLTGNR